MIKSAICILGVCITAATARVYHSEDLDTRKKIVVIDTHIANNQVNMPYMCGSVAAQFGYKSSFSDSEFRIHGQGFRHGENVVNIIASRIDQSKYCIYHIAWFQPGRENQDHREPKMFYVEALDKVKDLKNVVAVNLSLAGPNRKESYLEDEFVALESLTSSGIKVIVAAGNDGIDLPKSQCWTYPACLQKTVSHPENFYVVGGKPNQIGRKPTNYSSYLKVNLEEWIDQGQPSMTGTSQATANFTSKMFSRGEIK